MSNTADPLLMPMITEHSPLVEADEPGNQEEEEEAMDVESNSVIIKHSRNGLKQFLTVTNCLLMIIGTTCGPLMSRLYFLHGGASQWLSSFLETAGFPILLLPLSFSYFIRRKSDPDAKMFFITFRIFAACAVLGVMTGIVDFLYAFGLNFLPVSTLMLLISTQLAFTAFFAFFVVGQRFTPFSVNSIALLTVGAAILGLHAGSDRPEGTTTAQYFMGFFMTLGAAALYGLVLPLVELTYAKARQAITYTLVMEMQFVIAFFATAFCAIGLFAAKDGIRIIPKEAAGSDVGKAKFYTIIIFVAIVWQFFFLGTVGVIFCVNTLLAGVIIAVFLPVTEVLAVIFFHEKFSSEKGVALILALWGLTSYSYGEYLEFKEKKKAAALLLDHQSI